ncbi:MAG: ExeA family protein [Marinobacter sp.]
MYYDFFGFREPPFSIAPDPRYLYLSERHKEALAHLMYGVQGQGGFVVVTGEVGTGKTTISRCFIENVPEYVDIALILNPRQSARELLASFCDELGISYPDNATIKLLIDRINRHLLDAHARGRHQVLMIDEAQNLSAEVLEQLRLLTNLETSKKKLLQVVLLGQPELKDILDRPELRQLNQRVTARYHLDGLERDELPAYVHYRLGVAGVKVELFTPAAIRLLYRKSQGIPRLINLISDRALLGAYSEGVQQIEPRHIRAAAKEVGSAPTRHSQRGAGVSPALRWATAVSVLASLTVVAWMLVEIRDDSAAQTVAEAGQEQGQQEKPAADTVADDAATTSGRGEGSTGSDEAITGNVVTGAIQRNENRAEDNRSDAHELDRFSLEEHGMSTAEAYSDLFRLWGYDWDRASHPFACDYARTAGMACLHRQGSRRSLVDIDRPAVLELKGPESDLSYVTLVRLDDDVATIATAEGSTEVAFRELEELWFGRFSVLWELPPYMAAEGDPADLPRQEQEGVWLSARMMQLVGLHAEDNDELEQVSRLIRDEQVRWYQRVKGLKPDGVVGAMTLIQMSNDLDAGVPRLTPDRNPVIAPLESGQPVLPVSG